MHAKFHVKKPEWKTRPRCHVVLTAESGAGKSPFYEHVIQPCLTVTSSLLSSHPDLFAECGPKGALFARGSDADFAERMDESGGCLFLASDESISVLDTDFLSGLSKSKDVSKVDLQTLLSTQNGGPYGPRSLKSWSLSCSRNFFSHCLRNTESMLRYVNSRCTFVLVEATCRLMLE